MLLKLLKNRSLSIIVALVLLMGIFLFTRIVYMTAIHKEVDPLIFEQRVNDTRYKLTTKRYLNDDIIFEPFDNYVIADDFIDNYHYLLTFSNFNQLPLPIQQDFADYANDVLTFNTVKLTLLSNADENYKDIFVKRLNCCIVQDD